MKLSLDWTGLSNHRVSGPQTCAPTFRNPKSHLFCNPNNIQHPGTSPQTYSTTLKNTEDNISTQFLIFFQFYFS